MMIKITSRPPLLRVDPVRPARPVKRKLQDSKRRADKKRPGKPSRRPHIDRYV